MASMIAIDNEFIFHTEDHTAENHHAFLAHFVKMRNNKVPFLYLEGKKIAFMNGFSFGKPTTAPVVKPYQIELAMEFYGSMKENYGTINKNNFKMFSRNEFTTIVCEVFDKNRKVAHRHFIMMSNHNVDYVIW